MTFRYNGEREGGVGVWINRRCNKISKNWRCHNFQHRLAKIAKFDWGVFVKGSGLVIICVYRSALVGIKVVSSGVSVVILVLSDVCSDAGV